MYFTPLRSEHDLALTTNPLGCSSRVAGMRIPATGMELYPSLGADDLADHIARLHGIAHEEVMIGAGIDGLLHQIARSRLGRGARLVLPSVTFPKMAVIAAQTGAAVSLVPMAPDLSVDFAALRSAAAASDACVYLANPGNPTGIAERPDDILRLCGATGGLVIIDEANGEYDEEASCARHAAGFENLIVLRSFSKAYGLASIRVGYALGGRSLLGSLRTGAPRFPVAGISAAIASVALADQAHLAATVSAVGRARATLAGALADAGAPCTRSSSNCFVMRLPQERPAGCFQRYCRDRGIAILAGGEFGLPDDHFRVAPGSAAANAALASALGDFLGGRTPRGIAREDPRATMEVRS